MVNNDNAETPSTLITREPDTSIILVLHGNEKGPRPESLDGRLVHWQCRYCNATRQPLATIVVRTPNDLVCGFLAWSCIADKARSVSHRAACLDRDGRNANDWNWPASV